MTTLTLVRGDFASKTLPLLGNFRPKTPCFGEKCYKVYLFWENLQAKMFLVWEIPEDNAKFWSKLGHFG